jgi:hypothetical protein
LHLQPEQLSLHCGKSPESTSAISINIPVHYPSSAGDPPIHPLRRQPARKHVIRAAAAKRAFPPNKNAHPSRREAALLEHFTGLDTRINIMTVDDGDDQALASQQASRRRNER